MSQPQEAAGINYPLHQKLSWTTPYMVDYGICNKPLTRMRIWSIALRWYDDYDQRLAQLESMRRYLPDPKRYGTPLHEQNLNILLGSDVQLYPHYDPGGFTYFLGSLDTGSVLRGGPALGRLDPIVARYRPGFAFLRERWDVFMRDDPCPWPFWIFPTAAELAVG